MKYQIGQRVRDQCGGMWVVIGVKGKVSGNLIVDSQNEFFDIQKTESDICYRVAGPIGSMDPKIRRSVHESRLEPA